MSGVAATGGSWKEEERGLPPLELIAGGGEEERAREGEPEPPPPSDALKVEVCERRGEEDGDVLMGSRGAEAETEAEADEGVEGG